MKKQSHSNWKWQALTVATFVLTVGTNKALADGNSCANPSELTFDGQVKMKFCDIPAAQGVLIGSETGYSNERPVKARNFKKFQIAQFEVTQLQYKTVTGTEPWKGKEKVQENNDNPAVYVSYYGAQAFARVLNLFDKNATYRLPTEAEFEYAARAGSKTKYYWGDEADPNFAYFSENNEISDQHARKVDSCPNPLLNSKYPGYCANDFGLYQMLGNVWEWTADAWRESYSNAPTDGNASVQGSEDSDRTVRGGSWINPGDYLGSSFRTRVSPEKTDFNVGFRLVRIAK